MKELISSSGKTIEKIYLIYLQGTGNSTQQLLEKINLLSDRLLGIISNDFDSDINMRSQYHINLICSTLLSRSTLLGKTLLI
ncbi:MAG: hypothetical protein AAF208_09555 [Cyanobacteria bacterium P01_A01_bin.45]